jgi:hypothetical protein
MKKLNVILAALVICFSISINAFAQKNKGVTPITLNVSIDDSVTQAIEGDSVINVGVRSDGGGNYVHGSSGVEAQFLSSGVLSFKSGSLGQRWVNAYYSKKIEAGASVLPVTQDSPANVEFLTFVNTAPFQDMGENSSRCQGLGINIFIPGYTRTIGYQAGQGYLKKTGYVKVNRLANQNGKGVWTIESNSSGTCTAPDGVVYDDTATVADRKTSGKPSGDIIYGRYIMPFKLTLTQQ